MELFLNSKNAGSFTGFHPWVLERSVIQPAIPPIAGQVVELKTTQGQWLGRGIYNPHSRIRVRLYQWNQADQLDETWLHSQLTAAISMRQRWMQRHTSLDAVRWVNSEGDGLSGLVIDQVGPFIVVQVNALAMSNWQTAILDWLQQNLPHQGILWRVDQSTATNEGLQATQQWISGATPVEPFIIADGPVKLEIDLNQGQKTGYYLDQRANRQRAASWLGNGPLLDMCCYLGGFSLAAYALAQPTEITAVDSSQRALLQAQRNAQLNQASINFIQADCFDYLTDRVKERAKYQTVILDPPKMAGSQQQRQSALRAYYRLNSCAVKLLEPDGILVSCSCSGRISREDFRGMLASVAHHTGRTIQILESCGADFDHPIAANCPETEYLKCFICRVR